MKKLITICVVVGLIIVVSGVAQAAIYNYDVAPSDLGDRDAWAYNVPFGHDHPDNPPVDYKPIGTDVMGGAPGYGDSSFWADVQGSASPGGRDYCSLRIAPHAVFGRDISTAPIFVAELDSISYFTNWVSGLNWQIKIYTAPVEGEDTSWYRNRFNFYRAPETTNWNQTGTDSLNVEWIHNKTSNSSTYPNDPWSTVKNSYAGEVIMWIDIIAGYMTESPAGDTYLDGVGITINGGSDVADINLIPEPTTVCLLGLGALSLIRRKRKA